MISPAQGQGQSCDFNSDGKVDFGDFLIFAGKYGTTPVAVECDLNRDGEINFDDFVIFSRSFGEVTTDPLTRIVPLDSVRNFAPRTPVTMRTEFAQGELLDLEMLFLTVVDDFMPPMPVYMLEATDSLLIQLGGISKGMSGSPIYTDKGVWGAAAFGFDLLVNQPYYLFATPIEYVIGDKKLSPLSKRAMVWEDFRIKPLEIPLLNTSTVSAGLSRERQHSFAPGRPLAVGLLLGEVTLASFGTISFVRGNEIYGFGHAMDETGPVEYPIIEAVILGEVTNARAPYKFPTLNPNVRGVILQDRKPGIRGELGRFPELIPIDSEYVFPTETIRLTHETPAFVAGLPIIANVVSTAFFDPLTNRIENTAGHAIKVDIEISFAETEHTISRSRLLASPEGRLVTLIIEARGSLGFVLGELLNRDDYQLSVKSAATRVEVIPEHRYARIMGLSTKATATPGEELEVTVDLRVGRTENKDLSVLLTIPESLERGVYSITVSSAEVEDDGLFGDVGPISITPGDGPTETLEDAFEKVNEIDGNVILQAVLFSADAPVVTVEKETDYYLRGRGQSSIEILANQ